MSPTRVAGWALTMALSAFLVSCGAEKPEGEITVKLRPLDGEPYRAEIQALEAVLFRTALLEPAEAEMIAAGLNDLADKVGGRPTGFLHTVFVAEMRTLSREALWRGERGDRGSLRGEWMRIRGNLFEDAEWFCRKPGERRPAAARKSVTPIDRELSEYTRALEKLEAFVEHGRRQIRSMGELPRQAAADPGLYATQTGIWEDTGSEWSDDLVMIEGGLPEKPASEDNTPVYLVHLNLSRAIGELRQVPFTVSGGSIPATQERETGIDAAENYLRRARRALEKARG